MTVNGRSTDLLHELTHAPKADGHRFFPQMDVMFHGMFQGLISSLTEPEADALGSALGLILERREEIAAYRPAATKGRSR